MLVLSRRAGESCRINDDIIIKVVRVDRGQVKLAFFADDGIKIHREEIYQRIKSQTQEDHHEPIP